MNQEKTQIRRRRECTKCGYRFTTYEKEERIFPTVVKRDGRREPYHQEKIRNAIEIALRKRPISQDKVNQIVTNIEEKLLSSGKSEIQSKAIGEMVMNALKNLDPVAYIRFASVYRQFEDVGEFIQEIGKLQGKKKRKGS
jgi:transcriptional repressor NrdR